MSGARLLRALAASAAAHGCTPALEIAATRDWASAVFVGARFDVRAVLAADEPAERWLAALPEAELPMPRQFAREARVVGRIGADALIEVLVLEE